MIQCCGMPCDLGHSLQEFLEYGKILTEKDFERIRTLRHRKMVEAVMKKHGLKSASKRDRLLAEAEEEAEEALIEQVPFFAPCAPAFAIYSLAWTAGLACDPFS